MNNIDANDLKERLSNIIPIDSVDINKLYDEMFSYFSESQNEFISRRHEELQKDGYNNRDIYPLVINEVRERLFKGKDLTERQIKRIIYKE